MKLFQILFLPFSILYQGVLRTRNFLYESGIFGITAFDIPTIGLGNLAFGGTGKTPHIEYLVRLLQNQYKVSVLSRGYKRKTIGYQLGTPQSTPFTLGDEPYQILTKFPDISVAVSENRVLGVPNLLMDKPETELILLDDVYQHRGILPGLNILLTEQKKLYIDDYLVPSGYLREYASAANRADIIVVSKCEQNLLVAERNKIKKKLNPTTNQEVYFSFIKYGQLTPYFESIVPTEIDFVYAFAGIANPHFFEDYLKSQYKSVTLKSFTDHHTILEKEIDLILAHFEQANFKNKILVSTEKDFQKLVQSNFAEKIKELPFFYLPIEVDFFPEDKLPFDNKIHSYVKENCRIN